MDSNKRHEILEVYSGLITTEIKSLSSRLMDISREVSSFAESFNLVLLQVEDLNGKVEAVQGGIEFCRSELHELKVVLQAHERLLEKLQQWADTARQT